MFQAHRMTKPPKKGLLKLEYKHWFAIKDRMIRDHPHMQVGIVGRRVVAVERTRNAVYRQIIQQCGNVACVIERADDEDFFGDWDFLEPAISQEAVRVADTAKP